MRKPIFLEINNLKYATDDFVTNSVFEVKRVDIYFGREVKNKNILVSLPIFLKNL